DHPKERRMLVEAECASRDAVPVCCDHMEAFRKRQRGERLIDSAQPQRRHSDRNPQQSASKRSNRRAKPRRQIKVKRQECGRIGAEPEKSRMSETDQTSEAK